MNKTSAFICLVMCLRTCFVYGEDALVLLAGGETDTVNIAATEARLNEPFAAEYDESGVLWIVEMSRGNRLLRINRDGVLEHVAGVKGAREEKGGETFRDGIALEALFHGPHNLAIRSQTEVWIGDTWNGKVRVWSEMTGSIRSLGSYGVEQAKGRSQGPYCITFSPDRRTLHIANLQQILAYDIQSQTIKVVAGNGSKGKPIDGTLAVNAPLVDPRAVAADKAGNIYILERNGNALRVVRPSGIIETVVNTSGKSGTGLGEGEASKIALNGPKHLCIDSDEGVIIADTENHLIIKYHPKTGNVTRLVGNGTKGKGELSSPPKSVMLSRPHGVSVDRNSGNLVITDSYNDRILMLKRAALTP
jgi:sugar lactone lactonase YvrE